MTSGTAGYFELPCSGRHAEPSGDAVRARTGQPNVQGGHRSAWRGPDQQGRFHTVLTIPSADRQYLRRRCERRRLARQQFIRSSSHPAVTPRKWTEPLPAQPRQTSAHATNVAAEVEHEQTPQPCMASKHELGVPRPGLQRSASPARLSSARTLVSHRGMTVRPPHGWRNAK